MFYKSKTVTTNDCQMFFLFSFGMVDLILDKHNNLELLFETILECSNFLIVNEQSPT